MFSLTAIGLINLVLFDQQVFQVFKGMNGQQSKWTWVFELLQGLEPQKPSISIVYWGGKSFSIRVELFPN